MGLRVLHWLIFVTSNFVPARFGFFVLSAVVIFLMAGRLALRLWDEFQDEFQA
jgi:hypothetical protein